uniref:Core domain-containing protein n=1 Tax=Leiomenia cribrosa TaxID=217483 RepID=A0A4D6WXL6_9FLOR|nr:hypothetical protein [Leiomenia cribrosa]
MKNHSEKLIYIEKDALNKLLNMNILELNKTHLRISVKQGGCSGMSYAMNFEDKMHIKNTDKVIDYGKFQIVCDNKSLLYVYGMSLNYKNDLIGGGFQFMNPNAVQTCGCGKSFSI